MSDLLKINVNDHTEKKNGLTYLSWAWAWAEVLKIDPEANWEPMTFEAKDGPTKLLLEMPDETAFVGVFVTIKGITRKCLLPVMDHRNRAIPRPNAFDVNKAVMRCLAKGISMHGLGLYIYAGEDLPESDEPAKQVKQESGSPSALVAASIESSLSDDRKAELEELALTMANHFANGDGQTPVTDWQSITDNDDKAYLWHLLRAESKLRSHIKATLKAAA